MPRLGLGIHEFRAVEANSWTPRPSLGVTTESVVVVEN
jgi:hypothetical protein